MEKDKLPEWLQEQAAQFKLTPSAGAFDVLMRKRDQQRRQRKRILWVSLSAAATVLLSVGLWFMPHAPQRPVPGIVDPQSHGSVATPLAHLPAAQQTPHMAAEAAAHPSVTAPPTPEAVVPKPQPTIAQAMRTPEANSHPKTEGIPTQQPAPPAARGPEQSVPVAALLIPETTAVANPREKIDSVPSERKQDSVMVASADSSNQPMEATNGQTAALQPKTAKQSYWSIEGVFTPQLMNSVYNVNSDATLSWMKKYLQNREQNDKAQYSFNAGVRVEKTLDKHWSVTSGVLYSMVKFEEIKLVNAVVVDTNVYENLAQSAKTANVVQVTQNRFDISFSSLEVPLQVTYRLNRKSMFYQATAGVSYSYLFRTTSLVFDASDSVNVQETNDAGNNRLNQHSMLLLGGVQIGYTFSKHWSCTVGPVYRYSLNSLYSKDYILRQQPYYLGLELSVKYSFR